MSQTPAVTHQPGAELHGFRLRSATPVPEVRSVAYLLEHPASGARLLHLHTADPENLFSVSFPTPPPDDTGVAHILEHCVLAGSRRFPVREPFFEMIKMSMATFINAMTGEDSTYYPVASNVAKDLFNLAEVYFDAVFHPLLTEQTFRREGHHLTPRGEANGGGAGRLAISGIVYNEMKGAFSDPDACLGRQLNHNLLPDTIYSHESGGTPEAIPDLDYDFFRRYHATYYHPSNAYFFAYGDIATADYCRFLGARLSDFTRRPVSWPPGAGADAFAPARQQRWSEPRVLRESYPIGAAEPEAERTYLVNAWLTGDALDPVDAALMRILSLILAGNEAAPLRKAIVQSRLGADLTYSGSSSVGREATFLIGLRGSESDRAGRFRELVDSTLQRVADTGISPELVETAFRQAAFEYLEVQPLFPLHTLFRVVGSWLYGEDPLSFLRLGTHLEICRARWAQEPDLFGRLLRERLLDNPHRLNMVLRPDRAMRERFDQRLAARVQSLEREMSEAQIAQAAADAAELEQLNSTPNTPAQLASLPQLRVDDLPAALQHVPTAVSEVAGITLLRNDVFSNGVNYLALDFDLTGLPAELWPFLPRYLEAAAKLGVAGAGYEEVARRKAAATGGISASVSLSAHSAAAGRILRGVRFSLKALDDQMEDALAILDRVVFSVDPRDRARLQEVLVQARMRYRTGLVRGGARTASLHAGARPRPGGASGGNRKRAAAVGAVRAADRRVRPGIRGVDRTHRADPRLSAGARSVDGEPHRHRTRRRARGRGAGKLGRTAAGRADQRRRPRLHALRGSAARRAGRADGRGVLRPGDAGAPLLAAGGGAVGGGSAHREPGLDPPGDPLQGQCLRRLVPLRRPRWFARAGLLPRPARHPHAGRVPPDARLRGRRQLERERRRTRRHRRRQARLHAVAPAPGHRPSPATPPGRHHPRAARGAPRTPQGHHRRRSAAGPAAGARGRLPAQRGVRRLQPRQAGAGQPGTGRRPTGHRRDPAARLAGHGRKRLAADPGMALHQATGAAQEVPRLSAEPSFHQRLPPPVGQPGQRYVAVGQRAEIIAQFIIAINPQCVDELALVAQHRFRGLIDCRLGKPLSSVFVPQSPQERANE